MNFSVFVPLWQRIKWFGLQIQTSGWFVALFIYLGGLFQ